MLVDNEIGHLTTQVQRDAHIVQQAKLSPRGKRPRRVDEEGGQQAGREPVEGAVLDDVEGGHGGGGEAVQEGGLELALDKVRDEHVEANLLHDGGWGGVGALVEVGVDLGELGADRVEEDVEEDRAEVFDEVDGAPGYLEACNEA